VTDDLNNDGLRDAFERMSSQPPAAPDRAAAVHGKATQIRRRRVVVASVCSAALLATGAALAVPAFTADDDNSSRLQETNPGPGGFASPSPTPSVLAPTAKPSNAVHVPPRGARGHSDLTITVSTHDGAAEPADYPTTVVDVHITGTIHGGVVVGELQFDAFNNANTASFADASAAPCTDRKIDTTYSLPYQYREDGKYGVVARIKDCGATEFTEFTGDVSVAHASTHSNGPRQPVVNADNAATISGDSATLGVDASDDDGWISAISVDWGDGNSPSVSTFPNADNPQTCADNDGHSWPHAISNANLTSPSLAPGSYRVTATVTSTGCDGGDEQTTSQTVTVTIPPPASATPEPTPSG
jgi:hypothetical protein